MRNYNKNGISILSFIMRYKSAKLLNIIKSTELIINNTCGGRSHVVILRRVLTAFVFSRNFCAKGLSIFTKNWWTKEIVNVLISASPILKLLIFSTAQQRDGTPAFITCYTPQIMNTNEWRLWKALQRMKPPPSTP